MGNVCGRESEEPQGKTIAAPPPPPPPVSAPRPPRSTSKGELPDEVKLAHTGCVSCSSRRSLTSQQTSQLISKDAAPAATFEFSGATLYGDPIAVVIQALLHAMRDETEAGKALVSTWRTDGAKGFQAKHFEQVASIIGVKLDAESALLSANTAVDAWLNKFENRHVPDTWSQLYERHFLEYAHDDPYGLSMQGLLDSVGIRGHHREHTNTFAVNKKLVKFAGRKLEMVGTMLARPGGAPVEEKASIAALKWILEECVKGEKYEGHAYALDQMTGWHLVFYMMMSETPVRSIADGWNFIQRLRSFEPTAQLYCQRMEEQRAKGIIPPSFVLEKVGTQLDNMLNGPSGVHSAPTSSPAYSMMMGKLQDKDGGAGLDEVPEDLRSALESAISTELSNGFRALLEAWRKFNEVTSVEGYQDHAGFSTIPDGPAYYAHMLANATTTTLTPEEVHQLGLDQVKEILSELDEVLARLAVKDETLRGDEGPVQKVQALRKQQRWLYPFTEDAEGNRHFPEESKEQCLVDYRQMVEDMDKLIDPLFDIRPKAPCKVDRVPAHMENGTPAAFYLPGSFDGSRDGTFYCNLADMMAQWKSFMRVLMAHEGIPGHHFQVALQQEMKSLPFFRRDLQGFTAFVEGWALYTESLARDLGYFATEEDGTEGYDLLGYFAANLLRAARCVVDTGLHYYGWSKEQAMDYMKANTFEDPGTAGIEVERYCVMPGQATSYKVGQLRILALRDKIKAQQGEAFDIVQFHRRLLTAGAMPLAMLSEVASHD